ncbi:helix-turn-helix domain-containing protein [Peribacillus asahii]|uniref:helix-turn-helix domain-containing protein n=1 Tax=Peribacillus asahii TaxID=228899 RepID=UPI002079D8B9|nr:helix-turn-helix domain-containing protein [Peribacillus asahii]USK72657.1 helix-turn-helix domain-containing protein [Peribacillus asahii]USK72694.1 helix-turn-helix domain-containing protein [Peribacillus asahii]
MATFADRFKELRVKQGYSMQAIGELGGVGKSTIASYESGEKKPTTDRLKVFAEILGVSIDYLLGITDEPITQIQSRNLAVLLKESNDFHYNGIPLSNDDLKLFNNILERMLQDVKKNSNTETNDNETADSQS